MTDKIRQFNNFVFVYDNLGKFITLPGHYKYCYYFSGHFNKLTAIWQRAYGVILAGQSATIFGGLSLVPSCTLTSSRLFSVLCWGLSTRVLQFSLDVIQLMCDVVYCFLPEIYFVFLFIKC